MPSLLDLPDEVLVLVGEHFEQDAPNLGLFLLVHPRINAVCAVLRYRAKYVRFDSESPLQDYLQHKLWLKNVHSIKVFSGCYQRNLREGYVGRLGYAIREPEKYDQDLAKVISSLDSIRVVRLEVPFLPSFVPDRPTIPLQQTIEAIKSRREIQEVRLRDFRTEEQLHLALDLAQSSSNCAVLELVQENDTDIDADLLTPLVNYLREPAAAANLKILFLRELSTSASSEDDAEVNPSLDLPTLPSLEHLYIQDGWLWHEEERQREVLFLRELLSKASGLVRFDINARALLALAKHNINTTASLLHLFCGTEDLQSLENLLAAIPSSIHSLVLSGGEAIRCAKALLTMDGEPSSPRFSKLERLTILGELTEAEEAEEVEHLKVLASKQGISLNVTPHFSHPVVDHDRMANPVNPKNWAPRPLQLQPGLLALTGSLGPLLCYPAEERGL